MAANRKFDWRTEYDNWDDEYDFDDIYHDDRVKDSRTSKKYDSDHTDHVMNADEAKLMRKLQSQTGKTEEEIRQIPKYRKQLSRAQKKNKRKTIKQKEKKQDRDLMKMVTRCTRLAKEHPLTVTVFNRYKREIEVGGLWFHPDLDKIYEECKRKYDEKN